LAACANQNLSSSVIFASRQENVSIKQWSNYLNAYGRVPGPVPTLANSWASSTVSVTSSDNGQLSPAASNRRIVNRTVEAAVPTRRAISRLGIPADFNLITSRTWRIANLSVGIQVPLR
jgi:hypothetical protein